MIGYAGHWSQPIWSADSAIHAPNRKAPLLGSYSSKYSKSSNDLLLQHIAHIAPEDAGDAICCDMNVSRQGANNVDWSNRTDLLGLHSNQSAGQAPGRRHCLRSFSRTLQMLQVKVRRPQYLQHNHKFDLSCIGRDARSQNGELMARLAC